MTDAHVVSVRLCIIQTVLPEHVTFCYGNLLLQKARLKQLSVAVHVPTPAPPTPNPIETKREQAHRSHCRATRMCMGSFVGAAPSAMEPCSLPSSNGEGVMRPRRPRRAKAEAKKLSLRPAKQMRPSLKESV